MVCFVGFSITFQYSSLFRLILQMITLTIKTMADTTISRTAMAPMTPAVTFAKLKEYSGEFVNMRVYNK